MPFLRPDLVKLDMRLVQEPFGAEAVAVVRAVRVRRRVGRRGHRDREQRGPCAVVGRDARSGLARWPPGAAADRARHRAGASGQLVDHLARAGTRTPGAGAEDAGARRPARACTRTSSSRASATSSSSSRTTRTRSGASRTRSEDRELALRAALMPRIVGAAG
jgi:hypothetical protein